MVPWPTTAGIRQVASLPYLRRVFQPLDEDTFVSRLHPPRVPWEGIDSLSTAGALDRSRARGFRRSITLVAWWNSPRCACCGRRQVGDRRYGSCAASSASPSGTTSRGPWRSELTAAFTWPHGWPAIPLRSRGARAGPNEHVRVVASAQRRVISAVFDHPRWTRALSRFRRRWAMGGRRRGWA